MLIKFLSDFRGRETGEMYYVSGSIADVNAEMAEKLVNEGRAEYLSDRVLDAVADEKPADVPVKKGRHK